MVRLLLPETNILVGLSALNCEEALKKIVEALPTSSLRGAQRQKILDLLLLREQIGTTAIGQGIALPHCFSPGIQEPLVAFGISPEGVSYPSLDGCPVHFIFVLILPQDEAAERQKREILQNIKWLLCDRYMQERLKAARTVSEVYQLIVPDAQHASPALGVL
ncbi:MAG: PTS sugar transporter subunit IIA [Candidatus Omnitrophota bacterium]